VVQPHRVSGRRTPVSIPVAAPRWIGEASSTASVTRASSADPSEVEQVCDLLRHGERQAARRRAEQLAADHPLRAEAHLLLGMLYLEEGLTDAALACLRRATFLESGHPLAQFSLARALQQNGEVDRARAAFVQARHALAGRADDEIIAATEPVGVAELRQAIDHQLAALGGGQP
jgi:chemotaxis protein methyltransferase CheR